MKHFLKSALSKTPYRVVRRTRLNRFQAVPEALASLRARGFSPKMVIDGGANTGDFTRMALTLFPEAIVLAVEPQPGCRPYLAKLQSEFGERVSVHAVALCASESNGGFVQFSGDTESVSTGAHVIEGESGMSLPCRTLDSIAGENLAGRAGVFLKLDLQGYELEALRGAVETLKRTDVVLVEVSFYAQAYEPPISALVEFLSANGFELYDVAAIFARPRDDRPRQGDFIFVSRKSDLVNDASWS